MQDPTTESGVHRTAATERRERRKERPSYTRRTVRRLAPDGPAFMADDKIREDIQDDG